MMQSQDNEFGDKNNLETGPKWARFNPNYYYFGYNYQPLQDIIAVYHNLFSSLFSRVRSTTNLA